MPVATALNARPVRREHLLRSWHLVMMAFGLLLVLIRLAPTPAAMLKESAERQDYLSLRYLQLLSSFRPEDKELRLALAQALLNVHRPEDAQRVFARLGPCEDARLRRWMGRLGLKIDIALLAQDPRRNAVDSLIRNRLFQKLEALAAEPLTESELSGLAATSLSVGRPDLAARIYLRLSEIDRARRATWRVAAAQQFHASGQPATAGRLYAELAADTAEPQAARRYALLALAALTGAGASQSEKTLALASQYVARFSGDAHILQAAARLALANGQPATAAGYYDALAQAAKNPAEMLYYARLAVSMYISADRGAAALAAVQHYLALYPGDEDLLRAAFKLAAAEGKAALRQAFGRALLAHHPQDGALIAEQMSAELSAGDLPAALGLAKRLVSFSPHSVKRRVFLAQVAEWAGKPGVALAEWASLAIKRKGPNYFERALKLAPAMLDMELLAKLLAVKAQRGRLTNHEVASLAKAYDDIGEPEPLVRILDDYLQRFSDHREAWAALAELHERRGDLRAALLTWEHLGRDFGATLRELVHRAEILWQLGRTSEAYVLLRDALDHGGIAKTDELLLRAEGGTAAMAHPPGKSESARDRESYVSLLSQLFYHSEPRPESLAEYRKLWRAGALFSDSAGRYIRLAQDKGLDEEAILVAEQACVRFRNADFLLWALELAEGAERFADFERIFATIQAQFPELTGQERFLFILARYHTRRGDLEGAQRDYFQILALRPSSVAARVSLLWLLLDRAHRESPRQARLIRVMLQRLLADWRSFAENEPALWLPFATASALVGHTKNAVAFYRREWTRRPTEHLWLLGYAAALDAASRSSDAREIRRFAIAALYDEVLRAAHRDIHQKERELLHAYVELLRDTYGAGKGSRWLSQVLHRGLNPKLARELLAAWRGAPVLASTSEWVKDSRSAAAENPWGRYRKRAKSEQVAVAQAALDAPAASLPVLEPDAVAGEGMVPDSGQLMRIDATVQSISELFILSTSISGLVTRGAWGLGGHLAINQLFLDSPSDPQAATTEVDLAAFGMWRHRRGRLELGIGANLRADANLVSGWISESFALGRLGTLTTGAYLNELTYDSRWLRIYGARHRFTASWNLRLFQEAFLDVQTSLFQYHTRIGEDLGAGVHAGLGLAYHIRRVRPLWLVRAFATYTRNFHLVDSVPVFGSDSSQAQPPLMAFPSQLVAVGAGSRIVHRFPGVSPLGAGRWRYMADVWLGWMWPINAFVFETRAGVALALPRKQELSLAGFLANNRWLGPGVISAGLTLGYQFR